MHENSGTKEITGVDCVMTGHGPPPRGRRRDWRTWNDFREYAEFTRDFVAAVTAAWKNGKTVDQAVSGLTLPDKYEDYRMEGARAMIEAIFTELRQSSVAPRQSDHPRLERVRASTSRR